MVGQGFLAESVNCFLAESVKQASGITSHVLRPVGQGLVCRDMVRCMEQGGPQTARGSRGNRREAWTLRTRRSVTPTRARGRPSRRSRSSESACARCLTHTVVQIDIVAARKKLRATIIARPGQGRASRRCTLSIQASV